jgi:hypothetical protein
VGFEEKSFEEVESLLRKNHGIKVTLFDRCRTDKIRVDGDGRCFLRAVYVAVLSSMNPNLDIKDPDFKVSSQLEEFVEFVISRFSGAFYEKKEDERTMVKHLKYYKGKLLNTVIPKRAWCRATHLQGRIEGMKIASYNARELNTTNDITDGHVYSYDQWIDLIKTGGIIMNENDHFSCIRLRGADENINLAWLRCLSDAWNMHIHLLYRKMQVHIRTLTSQYRMSVYMSDLKQASRACHVGQRKMIDQKCQDVESCPLKKMRSEE